MTLLLILLFLLFSELLLRLLYFLKNGKAPLMRILPNKGGKVSIYQTSLFGSYEKTPSINRGVFTSNNMGFSNKTDTSKIKKKNTIRIMVLGGSTSEQSYSEKGLIHESWPDLL